MLIRICFGSVLVISAAACVARRDVGALSPTVQCEAHGVPSVSTTAKVIYRLKNSGHEAYRFDQIRSFQVSRGTEVILLGEHPWERTIEPGQEIVLERMIDADESYCRARIDLDLRVEDSFPLTGELENSSHYAAAKK